MDYSFWAEWDGNKYHVEVDDITRNEWRTLRQELGKNQQELLLGLMQTDLDVIAGVLWTVMRRDDADVQLDDLDITYRSIIDASEGEQANPPD